MALPTKVMAVMAFRGGMNIYLLLVAFLGDQFPTSVSDQAHGNPVQPGSTPSPCRIAAAAHVAYVHRTW